MSGFARCLPPSNQGFMSGKNDASPSRPLGSMSGSRRSLPRDNRGSSRLNIAGLLYAGGSLLISFAPPFPLVITGLGLMGFGGGFYEACLTSIVSHFDNSKFMNILYAFFGLGALVSPFIIGALVKAGVPWNTYYWFPLSLALLVTLCHVVLFKDYVTPSDHEHHENTEQRSARGALAVLWNFTSPFTNWATIAIAGFFLGPNTPGILSIVSARVPPSLKGIVISITIGLGLVGATLGPLLFGIVVGKVGPGLRILPPVIIVLASLSAITFWTIPPRTKRD
ncbi:major facilitator superfamily transporter [Rhizoctonia solani]|uniref:Major facilitator superfamily transporter n=1 Tax=Rhizoctonia solani TaxID=456999 RepID=A0A8H8NT58_9AGAM|nr:major facilitator superfamily transporter [Rhizoctonia solani]QRW18318.1 major facilitator superfamily transporter [Rhizoctonia solani]